MRGGSRPAASRLQILSPRRTILPFRRYPEAAALVFVGARRPRLDRAASRRQCTARANTALFRARHRPRPREGRLPLYRRRGQPLARRACIRCGALFRLALEGERGRRALSMRSPMKSNPVPGHRRADRAATQHPRRLAVAAKRPPSTSAYSRDSQASIIQPPANGPGYLLGWNPVGRPG